MFVGEVRCAMTGDRLFLIIVRRQAIVLGADELFEERPGAPRGVAKKDGLSGVSDSRGVSEIGRIHQATTATTTTGPARARPRSIATGERRRDRLPPRARSPDRSTSIRSAEPAEDPGARFCPTLTILEGAARDVPPPYVRTIASRLAMASTADRSALNPIWQIGAMRRARQAVKCWSHSDSTERRKPS